MRGINEQSSVILWNRSVTLLRLIPRPLESTTVAVLPCVRRWIFFFARSVRSTRLSYLNFPTVSERQNVSSLLITITVVAV